MLKGTRVYQAYQAQLDFQVPKALLGNLECLEKDSLGQVGHLASQELLGQKGLQVLQAQLGLLVSQGLENQDCQG